MCRKLKIVAEVPLDQAAALQEADPATLERVMAAFGRAGATAVVTDRALPPSIDWLPLGGNYSLHRLTSSQAR